ncbi:alpha/beta hydrolase family protein [Bradyrhizobium sp. KBS0727]|uniref:alpha/beta hydrolase family protein n=1 Tax=unclassified Bradyrhizobium TaxID=2631580 RepID=UPI00352DEA65
MSIDCGESEPDLLGWALWPGHEDLSIEFLRLMGSAQEGGATAAECRVTASRIDPSNDHSWYSEWMSVADVNCQRGNAARRDGLVLTARSNWLRAINYYQSAALPFDRGDRQYRLATSNMRQCARDYLDCCNPRGEVVWIPWPGGYPLEAYFLPAPEPARRAPVILCVGEPGQRKEEFLHKVGRYARERGMSLLAVDLLGAGTGREFDEIVGRSDLEATLGHIMDYLVEREDVDTSRIAILADGWGSSFVARGIAFDDRFAAAVCDGGIWDLHERAFLAGRAPFQAKCSRSDRDLGRVARNIKCPVLIATGERGWLRAERVRELFMQLKEDGRDVTLRIFAASETAAMQGHVDNPTLANEYIFDWIASRLGI